ncbi:hypothetical protein K1W54_05970 [Micromonospora sp. CPCC 205371]|nr:hypothetical protein [Micromonospora sp. CPCC 205371]
MLLMFVRFWRSFTRWRRSRPFWGGLFTLLAGLEIFGTTQMSLGGLTFQMGPTGFLSWLIPTILCLCGVLMWLTPQQRMFYSIVGAVTAVFSLVAVNLGGFLFGLLLGMIGTALGFAWTPITPAAPPPEPASSTEEPAAPEHTTVHNLLDGPADPETTGELPPQRRNPHLFVITLLLLSLGAGGVVIGNGATAAQAAPCPPAASTPTKPKPTPSSSGEASPMPTPSPSPRESTEDGGNIITDIVDGIGDLFGIGESESKAEPTPAASASASPSVSASASPSPTKPAPSCTPKPGDSGGGKDPAKDDPRLAPLAAPGDIPDINETPSRMTGTKLTMWNLKFEGVTNLPTADGGTQKVLQFSMTKSTTDDFELVPTVLSGGRTMSLKSSALTVEGNVRFFTPRFEGNLLGVLPQVYTPESLPPLPEELELPIPVFYTKIKVQLAYVDCDKLEAPDLVNTL